MIGFDKIMGDDSGAYADIKEEHKIDIHYELTIPFIMKKTKFDRY